MMVKLKKISFSIAEFFNRVVNFTYSPFYLIFLALLTILSFVIMQNQASLGMVFLCAYAFFACTLLILTKDISPILPILFFAIASFSNLNAFYSNLLWVIAGLVLISLVIHFFRFPIKKFKFGGLSLPIVIVTVALFLAGINAENLENYSSGLLTAFCVGPLALVLYLLFTNYFCPPKDFDYKNYFCDFIIWLAILSTFQIYIFYRVWGFSFDLNANMGFANRNSLGAIIVFSLPFNYYKLSKNKNSLSTILTLALCYFGVYLSGSEACLALAVAFTPFMMFFTYKHTSVSTKKILNYVYLVISISCVTFLGVCAYNNRLLEQLDKLSLILTNHSGRGVLYDLAISEFLKNPIFGAGLFYSPTDIEVSMLTGGLYSFNFHSVLYHSLGAMGLVGFFAYAFYYYKRFRILTETNTAFNAFSTLSMIIYTCYALVDTTEFTPVPNLILITLFFVVVEHLNKKGNPERLPLIFY